MHIQCTLKLLNRLKVKPKTELTKEDPLFSWHANLLTIERRQAVVLMNDKTRYVIVMYGLKAKEFSELNKWIHQAIREVLRYDGIKEDIIEQYIHDAGEITFTKTKDRSHVARLNKATETTEFHTYYVGLVDGINHELSMRVSRDLVGDGNKSYFNPNEELYRAFQTRYGEALFSTKAVELKVRLLLEFHEVERTLILPLNRTFAQLHSILQIAFSWTNSHLHEFYILDTDAPGTNINWNHPGYMPERYQPVLNIVSNEMAFEYPGNEEMILEQGVQLATYIPKYRALTYHYDFGDSWRHLIDVVRVIEDYDQNYPICTSGVGIAPPEDVGGEPGYDEFVRIMADPEDSEHEWMKDWASTQIDEEFDLVKINRRLKSE